MSKAIIMDMDGTLVNTWKPLKGSIELIDYFNKNSIPFFIVTNRVTKTTGQIEVKLRNAGFEITASRIINPLIALNQYIRDNNIGTYFFVGSEYQKSQISYGKNTEESPEYVILCDFENANCSYYLLNKIFRFIKNGSRIITTSYSDYYAVENDYNLDTGSFVKMFELLGNEKAVIIGKPSTLILQMAVAELKADPSGIMLIGDDVFSDIEGGKKIGLKTMLVKTGIYQEGDEEKHKPDFTVSDLTEAIGIIDAQ